MSVYVQDADLTLHHGDALSILRTLPDESVNCALTSPPFFGLRDYQTGTWEGGDAECAHKNPASGKPTWGAESTGSSTLKGRPSNDSHSLEGFKGSTCPTCGARRIDQQIGLEDSPDIWVARLVEVFREVRRVLRSDGTFWCEIGDSYASNWPCNRRNVIGAGSLPNGKRENRPPRMGDGMKDKDLMGTPFMLAMALRADGWWLRQCIIWHKCLSGGTWLYARTQKGEMPQMLKDLVRLDPATVELWNGERWTQVVSWTPAERDVQYEIEFRNGERVGCTPEHRWPTRRGLVAAADLRVRDVIDQAMLPEPEGPTEFMADEEIGWLVGTYLAEGSVSGRTVQLACHADEAERIHARATAVVTKLHGSARLHRTHGKAATVNLNGPLSLAAIRAYVEGGDAHTKHLSPRAWSRSNRFLDAVLRAYLDGDGSWDDRTGRWRLGYCTNDALTRDLRTLAARLGYSLHIKRRPTGWKGDLRFDPADRRCPDGQIVAVRPSRARKFWDVEVADDPHLFALASGTLTHNSNAMPESATDRCTTAHSYVFLLSKSARYFFDSDAIREPNHLSESGWVNAVSRDGELHGNGQTAQDGRGTARVGRIDAGRNIRSVWTIPTQGYAGAHFATWPEALVERIIKAGCPEWVCGTCGKARERLTERVSVRALAERAGTRVQAGDKFAGRQAQGLVSGQSGLSVSNSHNAGSPQVPEVTTVGWSDCGHDNYQPGTVLDPFFGSGTTGLVARRHGRRTIGIELSAEYCEMAARRLQQLSLLAEPA